MPSRRRQPPPRPRSWSPRFRHPRPPRSLKWCPSPRVPNLSGFPDFGHGRVTGCGWAASGRVARASGWCGTMDAGRAMATAGSGSADIGAERPAAGHRNTGVARPAGNPGSWQAACRVVGRERNSRASNSGTWTAAHPGPANPWTPRACHGFRPLDHWQAARDELLWMRDPASDSTSSLTDDLVPEKLLAKME